MKSLEENAQKTNTRKVHYALIGKRCIEKLAQIQYLRRTVRNERLIEEEVKRLNSGNACFL
jgi:hypothetical protein